MFQSREMEREMATELEKREMQEFMNSFVRRAAGKDDHHSHYHKKALNWLLRIGFWLLPIAKEILDRGTRKRREELERKTLEWLDREERPDLSQTLTLQKKNTALHIAVTFQQVELAEKIIELCPPLVSQPNSKGDTPLHIAAKAGHRGLTELLLNAVMAPKNLEEGTSGESLGQMLTMQNVEGDTPFHEALRKGHEEGDTPFHVALLLLDSGREQALGSIVNNANESPLYLAAEAGLLSVVEHLLQQSDSSIQGPDGQTPLHIAVIRGRLGIVDALLKKVERINAKQVDCFGKTAIHYAAALDNGEILVKLVSASPSLVYVFDNDGNSPLHIVAIRGSQLEMVKDILVSNPCAAELVDRKGRNALHLAAMNGNKGMLQCLLKWPELKVLINETDSDGNTPLHHAVRIHHYGNAKVLLKMGADSSVTNKEGLTALDICEFDPEPSWRRVETHFMLTRRARRGRLAWVERTKDIPVGKGDAAKSFAKTMSVIATLAATVTFAAAFTVPGGYKNDGPREGIPVLMKRAALKAFVISDTVAFCSSMVVTFLMVWTLAADRAFSSTAINLCIKFLWVAVCGTVIAFGTALYVVLSDESLWLAITVMCFGCCVPLLVFASFNYSTTNTPFTLRRHQYKMKWD